MNQQRCFDILDGRYRLSETETGITVFDMRPQGRCRGAYSFTHIPAQSHSERETVMIVLEWLRTEGHISEKEFQHGLTQLPPQ